LSETSELDYNNADRAPNGVLLLDKPSGITSSAAVQAASSRLSRTRLILVAKD